MIDWPALLDDLDRGGATANLSIEGVVGMNAEMPLYVDDPRWWAGHPDLTRDEFAAVEALTDDYEARARAGAAPGLDRLRSRVDAAEALAFITDSAAALRAALANRIPSPTAA
ncbi:hypothetical protein D3C87_1927970 [compost metagenome]